MSQFRNVLIDCRQCGRKILVKPSDMQRGQIVCTHKDCGAVNPLAMPVQYDERVVQGLPAFGYLSPVADSSVRLPLRYGALVLGTSDVADVPIPRFVHDGRCYISRRHCTLTVVFDRWTGQLRYQLQDGATDPATGEHRGSMNGTWIDNMTLKPGEIVEIPDGGQVVLGGVDAFQLTHYRLDPAMLSTYEIRMGYNPAQTE